MDNMWYVNFKYIESVSKEIIECRRIKKKKNKRGRDTRLWNFLVFSFF